MHPIPLSHDMTLLHLPHARYHTDRLTGVFAVPLQEDTAAGYALLPGLLTRSCARYPTMTAFRRHLDYLYGTTVQGQIYRIGCWQVLVFSVSYLNSRYLPEGGDLTEECANLLLDTLFDPALEEEAFPTNSFEQEQRCLIETLQNELNNKRLYAIRRCTELLCPDHPFSLNPNGTVETVAAQTPATTAAARMQLLQQARIRWLYQGSNDPAAVIAAIEQRFGALPSRRTVSLSADLSYPIKESRRTDHMDINQAKLVLGLRIPISEPSADVPAAHLMNELLGGCPSSLLFTHVREEQSLCYYCLSSYDRHSGILLVDSGVQTENAAHTEAEILKQLQAVREGTFSDEELEAARRSLIQQYASYADTPAALERYYIPRMMYDVYPTPEEMGRHLATVTREEVQRAARTVHVASVYLLLPQEEVTEA